MIKKTKRIVNLLRELFGSELPLQVNPKLDPDDKLKRHLSQQLFKRLDRDAQNELAGVRRIRTNAQKPDVLVEAIIGMMFNLQTNDDGFMGDWFEALLKPLERQRILRLHYNVFYLYVDQQFPYSSEYLLPELREALLALAQGSEKLLAFINTRAAARARITNSAFNPFELQNLDLQRLSRDIDIYLPRHLSICRKEFPNFRNQAFLVGRLPLHDADEIRLHQQVGGQRSSADRESQVLLAATITAAGQWQHSRFRLNAHRFGRPEDSRPQPEPALYLGNQQTNWEISIGAAEHDEIRCDSLAEYSCKIRLNNVLLTDLNWWEYDLSFSAELPAGLHFHQQPQQAVRLTDDDSGHIFIKKGPMKKLVLDYIRRRQFHQEVELKARALPRDGGQLDDLRNEPSSSLRDALNPYRPTAAIRVAANFWLVRNHEGSILRLIERANHWAVDEVHDRDEFEFEARMEDDTLSETLPLRCQWLTINDPQLVGRFCGRLFLFPPDNKVQAYRTMLSPDISGQGVLLSYGGHGGDGDFARRINPDSTLGRNGVVRITCYKVLDDGRGIYSLMPVQGDRVANPYFYIQPVVPNAEWEKYGKSWLIHNPENPAGSDLRLDNDGYAAYNGQPVLAEEYSYNLICGTSCFQLKISGTPYVGATRPSETPSASAPPAAAPPDAVELGLPPSTPTEDFSFDPTAANVELRLHNYERWADCRMHAELGSSNFAAHYLLRNDDDAEFFLKAYFPISAANARREAAFYAMFQAEAGLLFIQPPLEMLRSQPEDGPPWGLLFPRLDTLEKKFPDGKLRLSELAAIGYCFAILLQALTEKQLINFDLDSSMLCFDPSGRVTIVDFDNVYHRMTDPSRPGDLKYIFEQGRLPAKNPWLPPEAREFQNAKPGQRLNALRDIGEPFSVYLLAAVLLQLRPEHEHKLTPEQNYTVVPGTFQRSASEVEGAHVLAAQEMEGLLRLMLSAQSADRPALSTVVARLGAILRRFANHSPQAEENIARLLGAAWPIQG